MFFNFKAFLFYWRIIYYNKSLKCKKSIAFTVQETVYPPTVQWPNDVLQACWDYCSFNSHQINFFFYVRKAQTDTCPIFPDMAALSHSCYLYQLQTLESSTSHIFALYVCLFGCTSAQISVRSHIILGLFLLPSFGQFSLAKPTPLFPHRLCKISSSCSLCSCLCVSAGCHYAADHITSMWNQTQGDEL